MKAILASALCLVMCSSNTSVPSDPVADTAWLDRLVGTWEGDLGGQRYVEQWRKVDGSTYEGRATMYEGEKAVSTEHTRITLFSDHWLYLANPGGQGVTCFVRASADATTWIFVNNEHDFPKRIGYRIQGDALTAWIAGKDDAEQRMEFPLHRVRE